MSETPKKINSINRKHTPEFKVVDMAPLMKRVREFLTDRHNQITSYKEPFDLPMLTRNFGFAERKKGKPEIVLAEDVAVELGHPSTVSQSVVLITFQQELIRQGQVSVVGPDLDELRNSDTHPFAQIVMLALRPSCVPDPFELENTQFLTNRLPGYMVRSVPGRLWVRISKRGQANGLTLKTVGSALITAYSGDFEEIEGVEVIFVTSCKNNVEEISQVAIEANILAGRHKKLVLGMDGKVECTELDCVNCEGKPVCDNLRDIVIKGRSRKK
jgi:CO dehydrogenase/acetyl-CoA synthase beta subunit